MSIIIKGMEMPKTCCRCDLKIYDAEIRWDENGNEQIGAWVCKRTREIIWNTRRGENCPLVPLPEGHGRLVDADALMDVIHSHDYPLTAHFNSTDNGMFTVGIQQAVDEAPTIVPARQMLEEDV